MLVSCGTGIKQDSAASDAKSFYLSDYNDTLVNLQRLNAELATDFNSKSLGKPIGVSGTANWLVTVGAWKLNDRNILLQGNAFKEGNNFFPNPKRNTEVEFSGPFSGLIKYNSENGKYVWVYRPERDFESLKYQRTANFHLVVVSENSTSLEFIEVGSNAPISVTAEGEIIEWSVNDMSDEVVMLIRKGENVSVEKRAIATMLRETSS